MRNEMMIVTKGILEFIFVLNVCLTKTTCISKVNQKFNFDRIQHDTRCFQNNTWHV